MLESLADRRAYAEALGEEIRFNNAIIWGVFDLDYLELDLERPVESALPQVLVVDEDVTGVVHDDVVIRGSLSYRVSGIQPDGQGMTTLLLTES